MRNTSKIHSVSQKALILKGFLYNREDTGLYISGEMFGDCLTLVVFGWMGEECRQ